MFYKKGPLQISYTYGPQSVSFSHLYVFTYREGTKCPKRPYWGENRIKGKINE